MWLGVLTIIAIVLGPILAVQIQEFLERRRQAKARRTHLFRELMATRGSRLSPRHVEALNTIELLFDPKNDADKKVLDVWKEYLDSLNNTPPDASAQPVHFANRDELFYTLLHEMGKCVGEFSFDKVAIRRNSYMPVAMGELEDDLLTIRKALAKVFTNKQRAIPIQIVDQSYEGPPVISSEDFAPKTLKEPAKK